MTSPQSTFSNASGADPNGYGNYTSKVITLRLGQTATLSVSTNQTVQRVTTVWIDWNRDGAFSTSELVANQISFNPSLVTINVPTQQSIVGQTRMRVIARLNNNLTYSCSSTPQPNTEAEDYTLQIVPATGTLEAKAFAALTVAPNPTATGEVTLYLSDASAAGSYAAEVTNAVGACVYRANLRLTSTAGTTLNLSQLPQGLYLLRLRNAQGQTATRRLIRD
nr:T9SS type A sorting domain-containing protein [Hymenobacter pini]